MATSPFTNHDTDELISDINMTPLIDVLLVLLIIFLLALPIVEQVIRLDLPQANSQPLHTQPALINLTLRANGTLLWNENSISPTTLHAHLTSVARNNPSTELYLYAEQTVPYAHIASLLATLQATGLTKINLVTKPLTH